MGHVRDRWKESRRRGKGKRWQVKYQVDGRERDSGSYDVKAVAQRRLVELEAAVHRGAWVDPSDSTTVAEYAWRYALARPYRRSTERRVHQQIRTHLEGSALGGAGRPRSAPPTSRRGPSSSAAPWPRPPCTCSSTS